MEYGSIEGTSCKKNIEVFFNEASASAVKVVVATVRAQAAQAHVSRKSQR